MSTVAAQLPRLEKVGRVTQVHVLRSEWTKLRSVRSTLWSFGAAVLLTIALPVIFGAVTSARWGQMAPDERAHRHPLDIALAGVNLSQLAIGVLGVLVITAEYSTGMIRASMTAVPKRLPVLWGKAVVFGATTFALAVPSVIIAFYASQALIDKHPTLKTSLSSPGVARAVIGGALYLLVFGLFCFAVGAITRNTAGGIATFVAIMFVIPPLMNVLPTNWNNAISQYLPSNAGRDIFSLTTGNHNLHPWPGFALFCGYTLALIAVAAILLKRRDT